MVCLSLGIPSQKGICAKPGKLLVRRLLCIAQSNREVQLYLFCPKKVLLKLIPGAL